MIFAEIHKIITANDSGIVDQDIEPSISAQRFADDALGGLG
jgi:hypothetical protein